MGAELFPSTGVMANKISMRLESQMYEVPPTQTLLPPSPCIVSIQINYTLFTRDSNVHHNNSFKCGQSTVRKYRFQTSDALRPTVID
ncbi:hypothetical protein Pmani_000037 [Petrolisthes manimaculis]|uniref:Uncharacterized protein n=1 Tax=Petrolisthes manimaculis TaxID=1843537 RepID=A0AAE1QN85_9EUCA|nr:hypothetical protein Pmani_000037 [Petrolisthes manimaculis]